MADLFQQLRRIVGDLGEIISQTVQEKWKELSEFDESAASKVSSTFESLLKKTTDLSNANARFQERVQEKKPEIEKIRSNMKKSLIDCYQKQCSPIKKLQKERNWIHGEANELKAEAEKIIADCLTSEDKQKSLQKGLSQIEKRARKLSKKFQDLVKKEVEARVECTKLMLECDKKAVNAAEKQVSKIIGEIVKSAG